MTGYQRPCGDVYIPSSWAGHKYRDPPSAEPGTDYAVPVGTPVHAADPGVIFAVYPNTGPAGTVAELRLDDGRTVRYLHLSSVYVLAGQRVKRGTVVAASGASGNGSANYYGPHCHTTLLPTWTTPLYDSIDFELYVGDDAPEPERGSEDMPYYIEAGEDVLGSIVHKGYILAYTPGRPLKVLSAQEWDLVDYFSTRGFPVVRTTWSGGDVAAIIASNGLQETFDYQPGAAPSTRIRYTISDTRYPTTTPTDTVTESQAITLPAWLIAAALLGILIVEAVVNFVT